MENKIFLNNGIPLPPPPILLDPIPSSLIPTWPPSSLEMQKNNNFFLPNWEKSTEFDSAISSLVSSPAASNSTLSNSTFMIRELIGKLGNIGTDTSSHSHPMITTSYIPTTGNNTPTTCYSAPLNSPPKANLRQIMGQLQEKSLGFSGLDADPSFVERAARFSGFGSRSFSGRTNQLGLDNTNLGGCNGGSPLMGGGNLSRVSSSPSLEAIGSQKSSTELNSRKRKAASRGKAKAANLVKYAEINDNSDTKRGKSNEGNGNENIHSPVKAEEDSKGSGEDDSIPPEPLKDYIHVRARRGQATDSHSLAERVRREKISERMKLLQALVPGCNKVTGKALMLDEIINYVQSLQRQVEFLSMKLASVNGTRHDFNMDTITSKNMFQSNHQLPHPFFPLDSTVSSIFGHQPLQSQVLCSNISNGSVPHDQLDTLLCPNPSLQLPQVDAFNPGVHLYSTLCEGDLQTIVQMGLGQNLR